MFFFSRRYATLYLAVSVGPLVRPSVSHISKFRLVFALLLLPNRPRLDCRVSGLVLSRMVDLRTCCSNLIAPNMADFLVFWLLRLHFSISFCLLKDFEK